MIRPFGRNIDFTSAPKYPNNLTVAILPQASKWCLDATDTLAPAVDQP